MIERFTALADKFNGTYVAIAVVVCLLSTMTAMRLYSRGYLARGEARPTWLVLAGIAAGFGTWSTHSVAMLAYDPGVASGQGAVGFMASLVLSLAMSTAAFYGAANLDKTLSPAVAGIFFTFGVTAMHFTSMRDFHVNGTLAWSTTYVYAALGLCAALAATGFAVAGDARKVSRQAAGGALIGASVITFHMTSMAAMTVRPATVAVSEVVVSELAIAIAIAAVTLIVIATGLGAALVDSQSSLRAVERLRRLANGAFEGIVITANGKIVDANASFLELVRGSEDDVHGQAIDKRLSERSYSKDGSDDALLSPLDHGEAIPVEVRTRRLSDDRNETVYAIRDLRAQRKAEEDIRYLAQHDAATGLLNRASFNARLDALVDRADSEQEPLALLFVDLDLFKAVNDIHGHRTGDAVLAEVGQRLRALVPSTATIARLGGDEFVVALYGGTQPTEAAQIAHRLLEDIQRTMLVDDHRVEVSASIGVSLYPADTDNAVDLVAYADMALYRAKQGGRNAACFFSREMDEAVRDRRRLARELKRGIESNELVLSYQPLASMSDGRVVGFEALVRWQHPVRGLMQPDEFILVAEENGLIISLGNWVLERACAEAVKWDRPFRVAVNLSALHLQDNNLVTRVHQTLVDTGLSPARLEIEITESALFMDQARALSNLRRLKALGVRIAMDDFGTGYSSLSTLNAFPFDRIKIDRSFVDDVTRTEQSRMIVRAIVSLGHSLGVPITAEGVETAEQLEFLRSEGCDQVQGFLIGRPQDIETHARLFDPLTSRPAALAAPDAPPPVAKAS
jgi:diguanylate cyclase (GGDEF)-like protein